MYLYVCVSNPDEFYFVFEFMAFRREGSQETL